MQRNDDRINKHSVRGREGGIPKGVSNSYKEEKSMKPTASKARGRKCEGPGVTENMSEVKRRHADANAGRSGGGGTGAGGPQKQMGSARRRASSRDKINAHNFKTKAILIIIVTEDCFYIAGAI